MSDDTESGDSLGPLLAAVARLPVRRWTPPAELDEYRLVKPLGSGGMGSVWLAADRLLDRMVAIKFIAHAEPDASTRERFAIEARAAARLAHVNVVTVYRFGEVAGRPYLVSEYIRGESLEKLDKPLPWQRCLELGVALARGLAAAHRAGIVHRDIKPANAILGGDGAVKLVDFGLARLRGEPDDPAPAAAAAAATAVADTAPGLTQPGTIAGTPRYLAPEVRAGAVADRRSDVYQLGAVLYELAIGRAPIEDGPDGADLLFGLGPEAARLATVVERCLRRDPELRFASGDELREALERLAAPALGGELPEGNPYRGLAAFDAEHRALFFGRGAELRAVIERLRADPFVLVTGDSGVGKSSLCRAGVIPHVCEGALADGCAWSSASMVPGQRPVLALASLLARTLGADDEARVAAMLRDAPGDLPRELRRHLGGARGLLVFIDQLEELVTLAPRDEAAIAAHALSQLASGIPGVRLLATVRSDFLTRVAELPSLGGELTRALYLLPPLSADGAREAIVGPARAKGARFESEQLVDTLVAAVADSDGVAHAIELPLLAFTLAELWDARDGETGALGARSLAAIGGVRGALARHADGVIATLLPAQRDAARRLLLRLVTAEKTRARRSAAELAPPDRDVRGVLDALVRGRLVVARGEAFELAHERLIDGWPTLAGWLSDSAEALAARARLAAAAADWERLERARERLWGERQLVELARVDAGELSPTEAAFAAASRRALLGRRVARGALVAAIPLALAAAYFGARLVARRASERQIDDQLVAARQELAAARHQAEVAERQRALAFAAFDRGDAEAGERAWARALEQVADTRTAYTHATRALEAALTYDTARRDVRRLLGEVLFERVELAERELRFGERDELEAILALYDRGEFAARRRAPARLRVETHPPARVGLRRERAELPLDSPLAPGSYVITAAADGHAPVAFPVLLRAGELRAIELRLPPARGVPEGFVHVAPGAFLYGSQDEEAARQWFTAVPMHPVATGAYLIARTETTYAQWIEFLEALPPEERARRTPRIGVSATIQEGGGLELARDAAGWTLRFSPSSATYTARAGEPVLYRERSVRARQDWLRMPVSGISPEDALAFTAWLDATGRVPGARLCSELEWERAARGADGRPFPHGDALTGEHANVDETYGRKEGGFGMDEVGSYPHAASPFGLLDASGNVWEITRASGDQYAMRGGGFFTDAKKTAHLANRNLITPAYRHLHLGLRVCADPGADGDASLRQ